MNQQTIKISHGPQFHGISSTIGMIGSAVFGFTLALSFKSEDPLNLFFYVIGLMVCLALFFDFRGVLIDFEHKRIKEYQNFYGFKKGRWESLSDFKKVVLTYENIKGRSTTSMITQSRRASSSASYCVVLLANEQSEIDPFEIGEYATHKAAKKMLNKISTSLDLDSDDLFQRRINALQTRRKKYEKRRKKKIN